MKTVHQYLSEADEQALIDTYQVLFPPDFLMIENKELSVAEVYRRHGEAFRQFLHALKAMEAKPSEDQIFLATSAYVDGKPGVQAMLVHRSELDEEHVESYSWMASPREEILGYSIAETVLTKENINILLASILDEASFLGYSQERFESEKEKLHKSLEAGLKDVEEGRYYTTEQVWEHLGLTPKKKEDAAARDKKHEVLRAQYAYDRYCKERELNELRSLLELERGENESDKNEQIHKLNTAAQA